MKDDATNRDKIVELLQATWPDSITAANIARANVYAMLEVADAIDRLSAEVEKLSWATNDPQP